MSVPASSSRPATTISPNPSEGSFEFYEVGLNFTVALIEKLRTGVQLFARDLGPIGNYTPRADWFYLDYRFEDSAYVRAG